MDDSNKKLGWKEVKVYLAEAVGTFMLALVVILVSQSNLSVLAPLLAGITLGLAIYTIGSVSGGHCNPAVTLGALSIGKISVKDAIGYIVGQFVGALVAFLFAAFFMNRGINLAAFKQSMTGLSVASFLAETLGAIVFTFGVASVLYGKIDRAATGLVIGSSLLVGIFIAALSGALGILNPAVAFSVNSLNLVYGLAPIVGAVVGMNLYKILKSE